MLGNLVRGWRYLLLLCVSAVICLCGFDCDDDDDFYKYYKTPAQNGSETTPAPSATTPSYVATVSVGQMAQ